MKKDFAIAVLVLIIVAFFIRGGSFEKKHPLTFDEIVYPNLAVQLTRTPPTYDTVAIYNDSVRKGKPLPEYFKKPLFKHPPVFPWLISMAYRMFSRIDFIYAFRVSLIAGILLIALAYFLARELFDSKTALYAAFLMAIEPVAWITSQKIWMETTLALFSVLSLLFFAFYISRRKAYFMILSGIAAGCAVLTKYPGILVMAAILTYGLVSERGLFKDKVFLISLAIPALMLVPWFSWNVSVYGTNFFGGSAEMRHLGRVIVRTFSNYGWVFIFAVLAGLSAWVARVKIKALSGERSRKMFSWIVLSVIAAGIVLVINQQIRNAFNVAHVPVNGWVIGMFAEEGWQFYLGRMVELSPFYIFSFLAVFLFVLDPERTRKYLLLYLYAGIILVFYSLWGNYQSRYVTAVTVPLMVLSARFQLELYDRFSRNIPVKYRNAVRTCLLLTALYFAVKTIRIDHLLAVPNSICYF